MAGTRAQESAAARRIQDAATACFAANGYAGTSTRQITARLGMSAAAMYPHFSSKEELLFAIALDGHRSVLAVMTAADDPGAPFAARLDAVVAAFAQWQARHHQLARVVQYELGALTAAHRRTVTRLRRETTALLDAIVVGGVAAGEFGADDPAEVVLAISSLCVDVCRWFPSRTHRDPVTLGCAYARMARRLAVVVS
ncbi:MAG: TetR/AcrR family transcriptional regulator [Gordonia sp. (in: high G+C Gram-positive bacteria)]